MKLQSVVLVRVLICAVLTGVTSTGLPAQDTAQIKAGVPAPGFYLRMMNGGDFYSRDYYGLPRDLPKARSERHHMVLSFFATWCSPCRKEIPELERLMDRYPDVRFFLIDVGEKEETIAGYLREVPIRIPILLDLYGRIAEKFGVMDGRTERAVLPTLVIIDKTGVVQYFKKGYADGDEMRIEAEILKLP